jgi:hypothetical protein
MTEMRSPRDVALLALLFREAHRNRWESIDSIAADQDVCPGELSWFSMLAAHQFTAWDWSIIRRLSEPADFVRIAKQSTDPLRAEALLHAAGPNGRRSRREWAAEYVEEQRWNRVRVFMSAFEQEGITATRDDLDALASLAWQTATGEMYERYADCWAS